MGRHYASTNVIFLILLLSRAGIATPDIITVSDTEDDTEITLYTLDEMILGDVRSFCEARISIGSSNVAFTSGDEVFIWVYEDDVAGDDLIWETSFTVTDSEVSSGNVDRTFDCSGPFDDDVGGEAELYIEAEVIKSECGMWCLYDRPETALLDIVEIDDDTESDDNIDASDPLGLGWTTDRISRDQDWYSISLISPAYILIEAAHIAPVGRLDLNLYNESETLIYAGTDEDDATVLDIDFLEAGTYYIRVNPRIGDDYNFYDLNLLLEPLATDCFPGDVATQSCGLCGTQTRYCNASGLWTLYSACSDEGVCAPGELEVSPCEYCGTVMNVCNATCEWDLGTCDGGGVCETGTVEEETCDGGGLRERACTTTCEWEEFSACWGDECTDGDTFTCYNGPEGTAGIGACVTGVHACEFGLYTDCAGEVLPSDEICDDGIDNDCDGAVDDLDVACGKELLPIGEPCSSSVDCESHLICLTAPDHVLFTDGYCGEVDCWSDNDCGDNGLCVDTFDSRYCLAACDNDEDCREDYLCLDFGDVGACTPMCRFDEDCADSTLPFCDMEAGICVETLPENQTEEEEMTEEDTDSPDENTPTQETDDLSGDDEVPGEDLDVERLGEDDIDSFTDNSQVRNELLTGESACGCAITGAGTRSADMLGLMLLIGLFSCLRKRRA